MISSAAKYSAGIIALRIDQEQCQQAEAGLEQMFSEGTPLSEVSDLLERIVELVRRMRCRFASTRSRC